MLVIRASKVPFLNKDETQAIDDVGAKGPPKFMSTPKFS